MSIDLVKGGLAPWQAKRVAAYITRHLDRRIPNAELAQLASLSQSHFVRSFRSTFGAPPASYIAARRMERAKSQMLQSTDDLASIALGCGLADQSHFTRMFRRIVGMSPGAWRRMHEGTSQLEPLETARSLHPTLGGHAMSSRP